MYRALTTPGYESNNTAYVCNLGFSSREEVAIWTSCSCGIFHKRSSPSSEEDHEAFRKSKPFVSQSPSQVAEVSPPSEVCDKAFTCGDPATDEGGAAHRWCQAGLVEIGASLKELG